MISPAAQQAQPSAAIGCDEIRDHLQSYGLTLFGVELYGEYLVLSHGGAKANSVFRSARDDLGISRSHVVGMDEVKVRFIGNAAKERVWTL